MAAAAPWRGAAAVLLAVWATALGEVPSADADAVSMVQHGSWSSQEPQQATLVEPPSFVEGLRMWFGGFFKLLRRRINPKLRECCNAAANLHILPWKDWGKATPVDKQWWMQHNCNPIVGAMTPHMVVGLPNCDKSTAFQRIEPELSPFVELQQGLLSGEHANCTEEDRGMVNTTFLGRKEKTIIATPDGCQPYQLVALEKVDFDMLGKCAEQLLQTSPSCSYCYSNFMKDISGSNVQEDPGCFTMCMPLALCSDVNQCVEQATLCSECIQPALRQHARCVGGSIEQELNFQFVFSTVLGMRTR